MPLWTFQASPIRNRFFASCWGTTWLSGHSLSQTHTDTHSLSLSLSTIVMCFLRNQIENANSLEEAVALFLRMETLEFRCVDCEQVDYRSSCLDLFGFHLVWSPHLNSSDLDFSSTLTRIWALPLFLVISSSSWRDSKCPRMEVKGKLKNTFHFLWRVWNYLPIILRQVSKKSIDYLEGIELFS
jgi:hypothetical protein